MDVPWANGIPQLIVLDLQDEAIKLIEQVKVKQEVPIGHDEANQCDPIYTQGNLCGTVSLVLCGERIATNNDLAFVPCIVQIIWFGDTCAVIKGAIVRAANYFRR